MNLTSLVNSLDFFKSPTIADDINLSAHQANEDIIQSEATIIRAAYIKHMAQAKLAAHKTWKEQALPSLLSSLKGNPNDGSNKSH